jgi:hypothetical protein
MKIMSFQMQVERYLVSALSKTHSTSFAPVQILSAPTLARQELLVLLAQQDQQVRQAQVERRVRQEPQDPRDQLGPLGLTQP